MVDSVGVWWGLHSSADGQHEGLPMVVMGGEHGDVPLDAGPAWFRPPGWLDVFQRVQIDRKETFDSSATPKGGVRLNEPKKLATVGSEARHPTNV
jgi:hypothetical protein